MLTGEAVSHASCWHTLDFHCANVPFPLITVIVSLTSGRFLGIGSLPFCPTPRAGWLQRAPCVDGTVFGGLQ